MWTVFDLTRLLTCFSLSSNSLSNSWQDSSWRVGGAPLLLNLLLKWDNNTLSAPAVIPVPLERKEGGVPVGGGVTEEASTSCLWTDKECFSSPSNWLWDASVCDLSSRTISRSFSFSNAAWWADSRASFFMACVMRYIVTKDTLGAGRQQWSDKRPSTRMRASTVCWELKTITNIRQSSESKN